VILGPTIALEATPERAAHFRRACKTARFAYNWGLAGWKRMREAGEKPNAGMQPRQVQLPHILPAGRFLLCAMLLLADAALMGVERWVCEDCGAQHGRDSNVAVILRKLGMADAEVTRADTGASTACESVPASTEVEPRTETACTFARI
jgi:transposase